MPSDPGSGIPGWFIALFVLIAVLGVAVGISHVWAARRIAKGAGLDPNQAAAVTMMSQDGLGAVYLASNLASHAPSPQSPEPAKTAEERLKELQALKDKGIVSDGEYEAQRQKILGSI